MTPTNLSPWLNTYGFDQKRHARIFAFPYSGAGASIYQSWAQLCQNSTVDLMGIQLPGRENHLQSKPISKLPILLEKLALEIAPWLNQPFVFFGHSLGALIAFELCRTLRLQNLPLPKHLFISAFRAPDHPNPNRELHQLPKSEVVKELRAYAATPEKVLTNEKLMTLFLPLIRADFSLHETHQYKPEAPLSCPITLFSGSDDTVAKPETMIGWQKQTSHSFSQKQYTGGHFFLNEQYNDMLKHLQQALFD